MRLFLLFLLWLLCASTGALAFPKGTTLYVRANDTLMQKQPGGKGPTVVKLHAGQAVTWNGPSEKVASWHEVTVDGKKGFVQLQDLRPHERAMEIDDATGRPLSAEAFVNTLAKEPSGSALTARYKSSELETAAELIYLEEFHKVATTPAALLKKNKELGGR